ncbi:hypothetical protein FC777_11465 [Clostridium botulinum]|nr:hypothetical protein [Clostridium botulinum]
MIKKEIVISLNGFFVSVNEIRISHCNNRTLTLLKDCRYIGSIELDKLIFKFAKSTDYTNEYILIEK